MSMLRWILAGLLAAVAVLAAAFLVDIRRAYARIANTSSLVESPLGVIEFKRAGSGLPVLVVHGSGGGFDQGELVAQAVLGEGFDWIAPSRFGYLRSTFRDGATFEDQARAFAHLLDTLGIDRVAVLALSHGGPSALLFAALYPQRVSSLTLLSCGVASSIDGEQAGADRKGALLTRIYRHDLPYWAASKLLRRQFLQLMGADEAVVAGLSGPQRELIDRVIDDMNPASPRSAGVAFDHRAAMPNQRIATIRAPTLIVHARDDRLQLFRNAQFAAATIPGSRLFAFDRGGHLLIAVQQPAIRAEVQRFIRSAHGGSSGRAM
jgi:pimeloyl-ACP methyl ester carboxylesterase